MDTHEQPSRLAYTVDEAADLLGISRGLIYKAMSRGEIATVKIGASRRITPEAIRDFLASKASS
jgi:excisionase family DNA binding protein